MYVKLKKLKDGSLHIRRTAHKHKDCIYLGVGRPYEILSKDLELMLRACKFCFDDETYDKYYAWRKT